MSSYDPKDKKLKIEKFKHKTVIQRDQNANIIEIIRDENHSHADLNKYARWQKELFEKNASKEEKEFQKNVNGGQKIGDSIFLFNKTKMKFEVKNGQCVPVKSTTHSLLEPKIGGKEFQSTNFNLNLCKDIDDFLNKNPEAASCFKSDLNKKVSSIFDKYLGAYDQIFPPMPGYGYGGSGYYGMGGYGMNYGSLNSIEQLLFKDPPTGNTDKFDKIIENTRKSTGTSPIITSHLILQKCYDQGLGTFIKDESIWKKAGVTKSKGKVDSKAVRK